jgi:hypothetical protein
MLLKLLGSRPESDLRGALDRVAVDARRDRRERDGATTKLVRDLEGAPVARGKQLGLALIAAMPDRADGVDDVARGKVARGRRLRVANLAAAEPPALLQDRRPACPVNGSIHPAAAEQRGVRGVHDRIDFSLRDVALDELDSSWRRHTNEAIVAHDRMRERDPDLLLIERMLAPPPLEDARSSLEFWQRRRKRLPLYRLAARREAKEMMIRCQDAVRAAERAAFESSPVGRLLASLGISGLWLERARLAKKVAVWVAWTLVFRKLRLVAGGIAAVGVLMVVGVVVVLALAIAQLA